MQDHERKYHQLETKNNNQEENNIVHHGQSMFAVFETQSNQNQEMVENNNEDEKDQTITKPIQPNQKTDNTLEPMVDDAYTLEALDNDFIDGTENTQEHQGYNCLSRQWFEDFGDSYTETELKKHMRDIRGNVVTCKCEACDIFFTSRNLLNRHKRTVHAGERPVCNDCQKSFSQNSYSPST